MGDAIRKLPDPRHLRLPASPGNPAFPRTVQAQLANDSAFQSAQPEHPVWTAWITELGLEGMQLRAEDAACAGIQAGDALHVRIEARQTEGSEIDCLCNVRGVAVDTDAKTGREERSFEVRFEWIDEEQRELYHSLLKSILSYAKRA